eukprot:gene24139-biopygen14926
MRLLRRGGRHPRRRALPGAARRAGRADGIYSRGSLQKKKRTPRKVVSGHKNAIYMNVLQAASGTGGAETFL